MRIKTHTTLILAFMLLVTPFAFGQVRTAGVSVGNTFKHTVAFSWGSTDPNETMPYYYVSVSETEWTSLSIIDVSGTNVASQFTMHLKNGTDLVQGVLTDVDTGNGNMTNWIVAANLNPNDTIYTGSSFSNTRINETIARNYAGGSRSTNHLSAAYELNVTGSHQYNSMNLYWDRQTGFMVEMALTQLTQTNTSSTNMSCTVTLIESDVWEVSQISETPIPVGTRVNVLPGSSSVQRVSSSDYFFVNHGFQLHWINATAEERSAFMDPQQTNITLETSAPNFENPPMTHYTVYFNETDEMHNQFFFQFEPGNLAPGTYSFTVTWFRAAAANPPDYTAIHFQNTITLAVGVNTAIAAGTNVTVDPTSNLELTFSNVTAAGNATTYETSTVEAPLLPDIVGQYYDVRVTADFSGNTAVSLTYDDSNMTLERESSLQMMHYTPIAGDISAEYGRVNILDISFIAKCFGTTSDSPSWNAAADIDANGKINIVDISVCAKNFGKTAEWTNITSYVDTELNIVHGETTHFSIFGIH